MPGKQLSSVCSGTEAVEGTYVGTLAKTYHQLSTVPMTQLLGASRGSVCLFVIPVSWRLTQEGRHKFNASLRATQGVPGQPGLNRRSLSLKE